MKHSSSKASGVKKSSKKSAKKSRGNKSSSKRMFASMAMAGGRRTRRNRKH
jgi:hypothetical protein